MEPKVVITPEILDVIKRSAMYLTEIQKDAKSINLAYDMWQLYTKLELIKLC